MITTEQWLLGWAVTVLTDSDSLPGVADSERKKLLLFNLNLLQFSLDLLQIYPKFNSCFNTYLIHI